MKQKSFFSRPNITLPMRQSSLIRQNSSCDLQHLIVVLYMSPEQFLYSEILNMARALQLSEYPETIS